jgi:hypothetical protein
MHGNWLPITDYSAKHKVSVSTLRRRIKTDDIKYRFHEGKYLLLDEPVTTQALHRPSLSDSYVNESVATSSSPAGPPAQSHATGHASGHHPISGYANGYANNNANQGFAQMQRQTQLAAPQMMELKSETVKSAQTSTHDNLDGPILSAANRLLNELKKAYSQILQEKEEQILQLKEEVTDLKTLVRVLEGENDKLNTQAGNSQRPYDL